MQITGPALGRRIQALRKARKLSTREVCPWARVSHTYLEKLEAGGIGQPRPNTLLAFENVAKRFGWPTLEAMMSSQELDPPRGSAADAARAADAAAAIDNQTPRVSTNGVPARPAGGDAGRKAIEPSPVGALRLAGYPVFRQGSPNDPRRLGDGTGEGTYEVRPLAPDECDIVGGDGFGVTITNDSLANWEGDNGQVVSVGAIAWCDPEKLAGIQDGDLVVAQDPIRGLTLGIYRVLDTGILLETDDPLLSVQERRHCDRDWIIGPIVWVTATGGRPRRRARGRPELSVPTGPAFLGTQRAAG